MSGYDLKKSKESLGKLYPVLLDAHGNLIDGSHRLEVDPNWGALRLKHIRTEEDRLAARIAANICRRTVDRLEREAQLRVLAETLVAKGFSKESIIPVICEKTGLSDRYVRELLPFVYKREYLQKGVNSELAPISQVEPGLEAPTEYSTIKVGEITCEKCGARLILVHKDPIGGHELARQE